MCHSGEGRNPKKSPLKKIIFVTLLIIFGKALISTSNLRRNQVSLYKRAIIFYAAILLIVAGFVVYLVIRHEYLMSMLLLMFILCLWFIASLYFEKEIMKCLTKYNGRISMGNLFKYLNNMAGQQKGTDILEIMNYSIERLQKKKKVVRENDQLVKYI
jgi:hypothetical protein